VTRPDGARRPIKIAPPHPADRLSKVAHFIPVKTTLRSDQLAQLYVNNIVKLHGAPQTIVSDRGTQFTSKF
jgi:hypothetical protein